MSDSYVPHPNEGIILTQIKNSSNELITTPTSLAHAEVARDRCKAKIDEAFEEVCGKRGFKPRRRAAKGGKS